MEQPYTPALELAGQETRLCFTLQHWCMWQSKEAPAHVGWPGGEVLPCNGGSADVGFLPMMQRRRLSPLARAATAVAWRCRQAGGDMPSVFFSSHGESQHYFEMLEGIAAGEEVSPSRFSLCVHNAIAGLSSFHSESFQPFVALAGGTEGLFAAFLEVAGLLLETPKVLLVCYGQPLPEAYRAYLLSDDVTWAFGMVLCRDDESGPKLRLARGLRLFPKMFTPLCERGAGGIVFQQIHRGRGGREGIPPNPPFAKVGTDQSLGTSIVGIHLRGQTALPQDSGQAMVQAMLEGRRSSQYWLDRSVWRWSLDDV